MTMEQVAADEYKFSCTTGCVPPDWSKYRSIEVQHNWADVSGQVFPWSDRVARTELGFWTVYGIFASGEYDPITDVDTYEEANALWLEFTPFVKLTSQQ